MPYYIRIEEKEDLEWFTSLLSNSVAKIREDPMHLFDVQESIIRLHDAIANVRTPNETLAEIQSTQPAAPTKARKPKQPAVHANLCDEHTKYKALRPPRTDCDGCWKAYKKYNPMNYTRARRDFERKNA